MIAITNKVDSGTKCQACKSTNRIYKVSITFGAPMYLCAKCCETLKSVLDCVKLDDV